MNSAASTPNSGYLDLVTPTVSGASGSTSSINVTWTSIAGAERIDVWRSTQPSSGYSDIADAAGTATSYSDTTATPGQLYYYKLSAYSAVTGSTALSTNSGSAHRTLLAPASFSTTTNSDAYVFLNWNSVSGAVSGYRVYRRSGAEAYSSWSLLTTAAGTSYNDPTGNQGQWYYYKVVAYNSTTGNGLETGELRGYTIPMTPTEFTATKIGTTSVYTHLAWWTGPGDTYYELEYSRVLIDPKTQIPHELFYVLATVSYPTQSYDVSPYTSLHYRYRVRAVHDGPFDVPDDRTYSAWAYVVNP